MSLKKYHDKRNFKSTAEPKGGKSSNSKLAFVVQRHDASHLHFDFRLEMDGVLKSWAVPKGPSLNPTDKRLAMEVEDHPYDYKDFQGEIPEGNYGAGYVYLWDKGTYELLDEDHKPINEWKSGSIKIVMHGKKLKGEFALVRLKTGEKNAWLLIKHKDKYATEKEYHIDDFTPKTVLAKDKERGSSARKPKKAAVKKAAAPKKAATSKTPAKKAAAATKATAEPVKKKPSPKRPESKMKAHYKPMLTTLVAQAFDDNEWIFERKWDGYRAIASLEDGKVKLYSRNNISFIPAFQKVADSVEKIPHNVVLDGEIVVMGKNGKTDFQSLQQYKKTQKGNIRYVVFDLLYLDGHALTHMPLLDRKALLLDLVQKMNDPVITFSEHVVGKGNTLFKKAVSKQWEGIIAKKSDSNYSEGIRSQQWLKIKHHNQQEAIIGGYTSPRGSRSKFGALLLGTFKGKDLHFIGHCGGGFNESLLKEVFTLMQPYKRDTSPFMEKVPMNGPTVWLDPKLVCEVKFAEITSGGILRQPIFLGMRHDKKAKEVVLEKPKTVDMKKANKDAIKVGNKNVPVTNTDKIYWPKEKITKGELIDYYTQMADYIVPHLKGRPLSLHRFPNGIAQPGFYQKDVEVEQMPSFVKTVEIYSSSTEKNIDYIVCDNAATLVFMANLGCIEMNPWLSSANKLDNPNFCVLDLDPGKINFSAVVETALAIKEILDGLKVKAFVKTSGSTGLHIFIPIGNTYSYDTSRLFAKYVAQMANEQLPKTTSITRSVATRTKKVYIDFLQNSRGQTVASIYSARPKPGATVSMPLDWKDVNEKLRITDYDIHNVPALIAKSGDSWKEMLKVKNNLLQVIKSIEQME
ncbi:bifunctional non-homologous end joining protein LigD [Chitinophaga skermanii]|uniref:DNA ligase (ATP) n=1 Tax=Chitinophaga skermanii TaxID=331697 RepID=A0A327QED2_9BACT|nr:DNA ligase D [Chitinophaga skermanii]RAJ01633.1 bifunctional non-homologous end joining protein LigD [Chitinophaga skermanii]